MVSRFGIVDVTDDNFRNEVKNWPGPVLVDFYATWCGPCKMMAPAVEKIAAQYAGRLKVGKCDTDLNQMLPERYGVRTVPALLLFSQGKPVAHWMGFRPLSELQAALETELGRLLR